MAAYQRALELAPGYAPAYYNMGVLHSESKQVLVVPCPTNLQAHRIVIAWQQVQHAFRLSIGHRCACWHRRVLLQYDIALEWYQRAVAVHPGYAEAHCNMGVIFKV
jgi:tetratricopeptide (TPR) repeat protein